jgi:hypothetical protein
MVPLYLLFRGRDRLIDKFLTLADEMAQRIAALPAAYYYTAGVAITAGFLTCQAVPVVRDRGMSAERFYRELAPNLFPVDVRLDQSGTTACDAQGMVCVSMSLARIKDVNQKFFGSSIPPCSAKVVRESAVVSFSCSRDFQTDYALQGVVLRRSPKADAGVQDLSRASHFCLGTEKGKQGIYQFANCVKP